MNAHELFTYWSGRDHACRSDKQKRTFYTAKYGRTRSCAGVAVWPGTAGPEKSHSGNLCRNVTLEDTLAGGAPGVLY